MPNCYDFRRYGSPRVRQKLLETYGKRVSHKKVARLMRENGLNARRRRKFIPTPDSNHDLSVCENILTATFTLKRAGDTH